ncbi:MAG: hypothetical protein JEY79_04150 [Pseudodesulfovibrio sp.]|jgi:hypothetical protein|nr:hypothetical protein [Pseudodesulfovibrio sp.]
MEQNESKERMFVYKNGATYFSKRTERRILFIFTVVMLCWGIAEGMKEYLG